MKKRFSFILSTIFVVSVFIVLNTSSVFASEAAECAEQYFYAGGYLHEFPDCDMAALNETQVFATTLYELSYFLAEERASNVDVRSVDALVPIEYQRLNIIAPQSTIVPSSQHPDTAPHLPGRRILNNVRAIPQGNWYRWTVWDDAQGINVPGNLNTIFFQAPSNYELFLFNSDFSIGWQIPNNTLIDLTFAQLASLFGKNPNVIISMDFYLTVQVMRGPIAPHGYVLYYGPTFTHADTGLMNTGLTFNFGTQNVPPPLFFNSPTLTTTVTMNNANIPVGALITEMWLTSRSSGTGIENMQQFITATWDGFQTSKMGWTDFVNVPRWALRLSQPFAIQGRLRISNNLVWQPEIRFSYIFPIEAANMFFIPTIDLR